MLLDVEKLEDGYWRNLAPNLSIGSDFPNDQVIGLDSSQIEFASAQLHREGYFTLPSIIPLKIIKDLRNAMWALKKAGHPPVYIYIYDQSWFVFASLQKLISQFLGDEFALLPNFWAWHLETDAGSAGWPPHQDCQAQTVFPIDAESNLLMSLSLWVPLTEATVDNGCMVVLPKSRETQYEGGITNIDEIDLGDGKQLPAHAGAVLGWTQELYHWSMAATGKSNSPRMSLSLEFQNSSFDPLASPLLNASEPIDFQGRIALIEQQFEKYKHIAS